MSFVSRMRKPPVSRARAPRPLAGSNRSASSFLSRSRVIPVSAPSELSLSVAAWRASDVAVSSRRISSAALFVRSPAASAA